MTPNAKVQRIISAVRQHAASCEVNVPRIRLCWNCAIAKRAHADSERFYAHTFHEKNTVCLVPETAKLPLHKLAGIIVHELGHILSGVQEGAVVETAADEWVRQHLGLNILYDRADSLEYLDDDSLLRLRLV